MVHGGCIFTVLDTVAAMLVQGHAAAHLNFKDRFYMTASMSVDFKKPVPADDEYIVDAWLDKNESGDSQLDVVVTMTHASNSDLILARGKAVFLQAPRKREPGTAR